VADIDIFKEKFVPQEFWLQSYVLVGTVIAGLSIPSIVGWIRSKLDARKLNYYHKQIASLYMMVS
jgi:hypothetical protein